MDGNDQQRYENGKFVTLVSILTWTGIASAQQLTRAEAVAQALLSNPTVKLSLEQVALLEGRITEAKADALPDITWNTFATRSRDPGLLNSPNFDEFPTEFRDALRQRTLDWSLRHRWVVSVVAIVAFLSAFPIPARAGGRLHARLQPRRRPDSHQGNAWSDAA